MNNLLKLSIAILLGGAAAGLNAAWLQSQKSPPLYVAVKADLSRGEVITNESLTPMPVPGDAERTGKALIPYRHRSVLYGSRAPRSYRAGDMIFYRDIKLQSESSKWEILGPFRIVGVGGALKPDELKDKSFRGGGNNVTIAINPDFDERTRRLFEILDSNQKFTAVQVIPSAELELTRQALKATETEHYVHQTISLNGIENIPTVLYDGEVIRFILPASNRY